MDQDPKPRGMIEGALWEARHPRPKPRVRVTLTRLCILVPLILAFAAFVGFKLADALATGVAYGRHDRAILRAEAPGEFVYQCITYGVAILFCLFLAAVGVIRYRLQKEERPGTELK